MNPFLPSATTESDAKRHAGIIPTGDAAIAAHDAAGAALQTSGIFEIHLAVFQPVATGGTNNQANASLAGGANRLVDEDMRVAFIDPESVEGEKVFRA
ncbi:hypothetical protein BIY28_09365 [Brenneria goodwinii]|nr:hypothetical protein BIY28_09365 [Brenneria goodwinii]